MMETFIDRSDDWLAERRDELEVHLEEPYLNDIRKKQIRREIAHIAFEQHWRANDGA